MHPHSGTRALSNVLACVVLVGGVVWGLESWGVRTGVPQVLVCQVGQGLIMGLGPGLLQLALVIGVLLCIPPWTRPYGTTVLIVGICGMVLLEVWAQHALPYCAGST